MEKYAKSKYRPIPLATISLQTLSSKKLHISSDRLMEIAEKLYNKGFVSYPRTETDSFPDSIDLKSLIEIQRGSDLWGGYANSLLEDNKFLLPRKGLI